MSERKHWWEHLLPPGPRRPMHVDRQLARRRRRNRHLMVTASRHDSFRCCWRQRPPWQPGDPSRRFRRHLRLTHVDTERWAHTEAQGERNGSA